MTEELFPGSLQSATDLFGKLRRDAALLDEEVTSDRLFNFVVTGYSLIDWIKRDPTVPQVAKSSSEIDGLYSDLWLTICGDVATAAKHFKLTRRSPTASGVESKQGLGLGRFGKGRWGVGEEQITILMPDGSGHSLFDLVNGVVDSWSGFFARHGIPGT